MGNSNGLRMHPCRARVLGIFVGIDFVTCPLCSMDLVKDQVAEGGSVQGPSVWW